MQVVKNRKLLLHWCVGFFLGNVFLFWLIGLRYLPTFFTAALDVFDLKGKVLAIFFIVVTYIQQFALLAFLPCLVIIPLFFFIPTSTFY